jgi:cell division protein FtsB
MKKIVHILLNKYLLTVVGLSLWLCFFDRNDVFTQMELKDKVRKLEVEKDYYLKQIEENKREITELKTDSKSLEKFAREKYLMKKSNEEIFVIVNK